MQDKHGRSGRYALMLTYEQTRKLPRHVRATVQFSHLQRQVLIITWRKLIGSVVVLDVSL